MLLLDTRDNILLQEIIPELLASICIEKSNSDRLVYMVRIPILSLTAGPQHMAFLPNYTERRTHNVVQCIHSTLPDTPTAAQNERVCRLRH